MTYLVFDCEDFDSLAALRVRFGALCLAFRVDYAKPVDVQGQNFAYELNSIAEIPDLVLVAWAKSYAVGLELRDKYSRDSYLVETAEDILAGVRSFAEVQP